MVNTSMLPVSDTTALSASPSRISPTPPSRQSHDQALRASRAAMASLGMGHLEAEFGTRVVRERTKAPPLWPFRGTAVVEPPARRRTLPRTCKTAACHQDNQDPTGNECSGLDTCECRLQSGR